MRWWFGVGGAHYGTVLTWRGDWARAEVELRRAAEILSATHPPVASESVVRLGELRRRQGRYDEAAQLFAQVEPHPLARLGLAELALDRGEAENAREAAERILRQIPAAAHTQRIPVLDVLVRAEIATGDTESAVLDFASLDALTTHVATVPLRAATAATHGALLMACGSMDAARRSYEDSIDLYDTAGTPYEAAAARLRLAEVLHALGRGAEADALQAQANRTLAPLRGATAAPGRLTAREREVVRLVAAGLSDRDIAARLVLSEHTVHRHVANVLTKLAVPTRAAAVALAQRRGLL